MPSDLETQVAEAKCPECENGVGLGYRPLLDSPCDNCQGSGLRWPTLSRECQAITYVREGQMLDDLEKDWVCPGGCSFCHGSGRIPDVTLEKVLEIFADMGVAFHFTYGAEGRGIWLESREGVKTHWAETWTLATCAALLETVPTS